MFIDADTHIDECTDTWSYFPKDKLNFRPYEMAYIDGEQPPYLKGRFNGWFIDGQIFGRKLRSDELTGTTVGARELSDVPARLRDMDALGIDVQVVYPTVLLHEVTHRPEVEIPICESYNRWLADRTSESNGRIRWAASLPLRSIPDALVEMGRAKKDGAIAIFKRAFECDRRRAGDPYFYPVYQLAEELDLPVCIHVGREYTGYMQELSKSQSGVFLNGFMLDAFLSILISEVPKRFPNLRFGFIEAGASWLPYTLWMSKHGVVNADEQSKFVHMTNEEILYENRLFTTVELTEDLESVIHQIGDTALCLGTDYVHSDHSAMLNVHAAVAEVPFIDKESARRITRSNAQRLYGIEESVLST